METILKKIFVGDRQEALDAILQRYNKQWFAIVSYVYFANIYGKKLFEHHKEHYVLSHFQNALLEDYKKTTLSLVHKLYQDALLDSDFALMDGIALQLFYFLAKWKWLPNLNGTDFAPFVLESLVQKFGAHNVRMVIYGTYPHLLQKTKIYLQDKWYQVFYAQDGYTNLDRDQVEKVLPAEEWTINVMLVARSTAVYPVQEMRVYANKERIQKNKLWVMNQAGTFDWRVGEQKRPPMIVRKLRLEWLRRLISDPKRNYKKVLDSLGILHYIFSYLLLKKCSR